SHLRRCGMVLKPSTLLHFHHVLTNRKYHLLFSSKRGARPGPKGPARELIDAVVEMKRRNPIDRSAVNAESDDAATELVHNHRAEILRQRFPLKRPPQHRAQ